MRVTTATNDDTDKYTDLQMNQTQSIPEFNANRMEVGGSSRTQMKTDKGGYSPRANPKAKKSTKEQEPKQIETPVFDVDNNLDGYVEATDVFDNL
jgi:hypothetical protein